MGKKPADAGFYHGFFLFLIFHSSLFLCGFLFGDDFAFGLVGFGFAGGGALFLFRLGLFRFGLLFLCFFRHFLEAVNASHSIDGLLFAGIERMTLRADFDGERFFGGSDGENGSARAGHGRFFPVSGVEFFLHNNKKNRSV